MAKLYPGIPFSPPTTLTENIGAADTIIKVADASVFPPAPNYATIGTDEDGETIEYAAKADGLLSGCTRGVEGTAKAWQKGDVIARNFTAKDHNDMISAANTAQESADNAQSTANAAKSTAEEALPRSGGTMTGIITSNRAINQPALYFVKNEGVEKLHFYNESDRISFGSTTLGAVNPEDGRVIVGGIKSPYTEDDAANKLYVDSSIIRTNLLDNAYFVNPVNQRGKISYTNEMSIDRWKIDGGTLTVEADGINISRGENSTSLRYITETDLFGKTITFSVLTANNELFTGTGVIQKGSDWTNYNVIFSNDIIQLWLQQVPTGLYSFNISFLQNRKLVASNAELGEFQTLAHKEGDTWVLNDPPPDRALELLKCQRYQFVPTNNISHFGIIGYGDADTPSTIQFTVPLPSCLRTPPSISMTGTYEIRGNGLREFFNANDVTITNSQHSPHYAHIDIVNLPSSITLNPWNIYMLVNAGDNNNIIIDANL